MLVPQPTMPTSTLDQCLQSGNGGLNNLLSLLAGIPFVIINSLCGCLCAYGLAGLRLSAHAVLLNLCITALQSMISIQLQARRPRPTLHHISNPGFL